MSRSNCWSEISGLGLVVIEIVVMLDFGAEDGRFFSLLGSCAL